MTDAPHILVVDDDDRLRKLLKRYLTSQGYLVTTASSARKAREFMQALNFDLAIFDIMMPEEDGLSLLAGLREGSAMPVILLTARDMAADRIGGLKLGADDYLTKPFEPEELSLRILSILRRVPVAQESTVPVEMSGQVFDPVSGILRAGDKTVHLTETERQLLSLLAKYPGKPVERHILASNGLERSIDVQVTRLRKKIEPDPREPIHLQTVRGIGYRLMPD